LALDHQTWYKVNMLQRGKYNEMLNLLSGDVNNITGLVLSKASLWLEEELLDLPYVRY
jgi:hypothetical protein